MTIRYEYKYLLSYREYVLIKEYIRFILSPDVNGDKYSITSIYYDTNDFLMYKQKRDGLFDHNKIRLRQYSEHFDRLKPMYLESKQKRELTQLKKRIKFNNFGEFEQHMSFDSNKNEYFHNFNLTTPIKPVVNVIYDREAFEDTIEDKRLRVTFDSNLKSQSISKSLLINEDHILKDSNHNSYIIMEVKFDNKELPEVMRKIIKKFKLQSESFSKYAYCFEQNLLHHHMV